MPELKYIYIIYKTTNLVNQKIYIGVHKQKFKKLLFPIIFDGYFGSGKALKPALKKYYKENFIRETLFVFYTRDEAYVKEKEIVNKEFIKRKDTYNLVVGGHGRDRVNILPMAKETKEKIGLANAGEKNGMFGKKHSTAIREKISKKVSGRKLKPHHVKILSDKMIGMVYVKDLDGKTIKVHNTDLRYLSGELIHVQKGIKHEKITCPFCGIEGSLTTVKRWHFDNCRFKKAFLFMESLKLSLIL
jgi:hypothetical protein